MKIKYQKISKLLLATAVIKHRVLSSASSSIGTNDISILPSSPATTRAGQILLYDEEFRAIS